MAAADWHEEFADGLLSGPDAHFARNAGCRRGSGGAGGVPEFAGAVLQRVAGGDCRGAAAHRLIQRFEFMTLSSFVVRNTFRNKRRSLLTMLSISFSLLLLTLMVSIWRTFYVDMGAPLTAKRIITRDRVSLSFLLPAYYRDKIRGVPGVVAVVPMTYFGNHYKDDRASNAFAQLAPNPDDYLKVASDKYAPPDQVLAWQRDRAGALVDVTLADKYGWKIGDKITLLGTIFPVSPALTIRGIYRRDPPQNALYFNAKYLEESLSWFNGKAGWYATQLSDPATLP